MARISDIIAEFIKNSIEENKTSEVIIQRNELAYKFNCAPSQINYVLTTRFTSEKGYVIESRRGGGGYIVIRKINYGNKIDKFKLLNDSIGENITYGMALTLVEHLQELKLITKNEAEIIKISVNDRTLISVEDKNKVRAEILRGMITVILS